MNHRLAAIVVNGLLVALAVVSLGPLLWMLSVSFMQTGEAGHFPPPLLPAAPTLDTGRTQLRVGTPSICTVQAPHCALPQPYLEPVRPSCSRNTHNSGVSLSASKSRTAPFTFSFAMSSLLVFLCF